MANGSVGLQASHSVTGLVNEFYGRHAGLSSDQPIESLNPPKVFAMRKVRSMDDVNLRKLEKLGVSEKISQPVLVKRKWGAAVGISALISSQNAGFKADGPDDMANLAKESVEGVAQPLVHLGVLGLFYPFVAMGAKGLQQDLVDLQTEQGELQEAISATHKQLAELASDLQEEGFTLPAFEPNQVEPGSKAFANYKRSFLALSQVLPGLITSQPNQAALLIQYQKHAIKLGFLLQDHLANARDTSESWTAAKGMRGMQRAMQLFIVEAASSLMTFVTSGQAASTFSSVATGVGFLGTGLMAGAQFLMMTAGLFKIRAGALDFQDMRLQRKADQNRLVEIKELDEDLGDVTTKNKEIKTALRNKIQHDTNKARWSLMRDMLPGASLAIGQALMLSWSIASLVFVATGVGAPVGIAMMLALLIPGVGLTLAASLPKIGLEAIFDSALDDRFGAHTDEDGFDEIEYAQSLPRNEHELAIHANALEHLMSEVESASSAQFLQSLRNSASGVDAASDFTLLYQLLGRADQLEEFSCELMRNKKPKNGYGESMESLFSFERIIEKADVKPILDWKNLKNPLNLRHTQLFHKNQERVKEKTLMHFEPTRVEGSGLKSNVIEAAIISLKGFAIKQLRAELQVTRQMLEIATQISPPAMLSSSLAPALEEH